MGFFSELKNLAKDVGEIVKDCGQEIGGILDDAKQEFKDDPKKYTVESLKEIGEAAVTVGTFAVTEVLPATINALNEHNEKTAKKIEKMTKDKN